MSNTQRSTVPPAQMPARRFQPLTQAWSGLPAPRRRELSLVLSQIIVKGLPAAMRKEAGREHS